MSGVISKVRRGLRKPPGYIMHRLLLEARAEAERYWGPRRARNLDLAGLLASNQAATLHELWGRLQAQPYVAPTAPVASEDYARISPGDTQRILRSAENAVAHRVDLLGSGLVDLGDKIDWHKDYKVNFSWPMEYHRNIDYMNAGLPSDVKFPWEVSRMQWLIPAGQAYLLTGDERYAAAVRGILEHWIQSNPYSYGVNWVCTMDVALRIISWTWFFRVFAESKSWNDPVFQETFLRALFLQALFTEKHLEKSDINGNHYISDAAGLVFAGLFFHQGADAKRWLDLGWQILCSELPRQVFDDGVDFEGSIPYHRLVSELFLLPAIYRQSAGLQTPDFYRKRITKMVSFTAAYSRPDGSAPLWGDADDGRVLPFGGQPINDHRYLIGVAGCALDPNVKGCFSGSRAEIYWLLGRNAAESLPSGEVAAGQRDSAAFPQGGFYMMRSDRDHIFIDCGPVGMSGRGGHGHNDLLSFEAVLDGIHLITDCGAFVYSADYDARNRFRATAAHNTPMIAGEEINRFVAPDHLWSLRNDARPELRRWETTLERDLFCGAHSGYQRLASPITPVRTIELDKRTHTLTVMDEFEGSPQGMIEVPLHLVPGVEVLSRTPEGRVTLRAQQREFDLIWKDPGAWQMSVADAKVSPSYGVALNSKRIVWTAMVAGALTLSIVVRPQHGEFA
jgi:uncharacterized heparinase superfamily protein